MLKIVSSIFILTIFANPAGAALGKAEYCDAMAEIGVEVLELLDADIPLDDAIETIVQKYSRKYPNLVGDTQESARAELETTVRVLYGGHAPSSRGEEYRRSYLEIS